MSKVLVTGGGGFIGGHLASRLVELGHEVHLLENFSRAVRDSYLEGLLASPGVRLIEADLTRPESAGRVGTDYEFVYHLAAIVGVANVLRAPVAVLTGNVRMLEAALEIAARQTRLRRFVFTSTSEVYVGTLEKLGLPFPTPEDVPLVCPDLGSKRMSYMLSKIYGEAMCRAAQVPTTMVRPHNVYGPRMGLSHVIPELLQRAHSTREGGNLEVFSVGHKRTFCYIADAVEMLRLAAENDGADSGTYNLGNQSPEVTILELARLVVAAVGKRLCLVPKPDTVSSPARRAPDTTKIRNLTGYTSRIDLREGIQRTLQWYSAQVFSGAEQSSR